VTGGSAQIINASGNVDTFNIAPGSDGVTVNASGMSNTFNLNGSTNSLIHTGDGTGAGST
jgi:hypothetical protein